MTSNAETPKHLEANQTWRVELTKFTDLYNTDLDKIIDKIIRYTYTDSARKEILELAERDLQQTFKDLLDLKMKITILVVKSFGKPGLSMAIQCLDSGATSEEYIEFHGRFPDPNSLTPAESQLVFSNFASFMRKYANSHKYYITMQEMLAQNKDFGVVKTGSMRPTLKKPRGKIGVHTDATYDLECTAIGLGKLYALQEKARIRAALEMLRNAEFCSDLPIIIHADTITLASRKRSNKNARLMKCVDIAQSCYKELISANGLIEHYHEFIRSIANIAALSSKVNTKATRLELNRISKFYNLPPCDDDEMS